MSDTEVQGSASVSGRTGRENRIGFPKSGTSRFEVGQRPSRPRGPSPFGKRTTIADTAATTALKSSEQPIGAHDAAIAPLRQALPTHRDAIFRRLLAVADLVAALGAVATTNAITGRHAPFSLVAVPLIVLISKLFGRYDHDEVVLHKSTLDEVPSLLTVAGSFALAWSAVALLPEGHAPLSAASVAVLWSITAALLVLTRAAARAIGQRSAPGERVLIVGPAAMRQQLAHSLSSDPTAKIDVVGFLPLTDERTRLTDWGGRCRRKRQLSFDDLAMLVGERDVQRIFLIPANVDSETMVDVVSRTTALGVKVSIVPRLLEVVGSAVEFDTVGGVTVLGFRPAGLTRSSRAVKRAMDLVGATLALVAIAPFGLFLTIAIKLDSRGPVFFRQRRVGRFGREFDLIKFRSMFDGADAQRAALAERNETHGIFKLASDPRVTRIGRFMRRTSIDELPQLINVLRGDMSLVGPRPLVIDEDRLVEGRHRERLQFAPGMTGPWQVLGPSRPPLSEMVKTDYLYATSWSLWTDVKILVRTLSHVVGLRGV